MKQRLGDSTTQKNIHVMPFPPLHPQTHASNSTHQLLQLRQAHQACDRQPPSALNNAADRQALQLRQLQHPVSNIKRVAAAQVLEEAQFTDAAAG